MLRPGKATSLDEASEDAPDAREPRTPLNEAISLGALYGTLNQVAPLVRLYACGALAIGGGSTAGGVLWPMLSALAATMAAAPLRRLAGALVPGDKESSAFHQARLATSQLLRAGLQALLTVIAFTQVDRDACGLRPSPASLPAELVVGALSAIAMSAGWSFAPWLLGVEPREALTMAGGTHDLSNASEDELLRGMRPPLHMAHLAGRCCCVVLDTVADALLFFVFLASAIAGQAPPTTAIYTAASGLPIVAVAVSALAFGSQHLRWRGEWLLATIFATALLALCRAHEGSLLGSLLAATLFAVFRYQRRSQDVRRFHAQ